MSRFLKIKLQLYRAIFGMQMVPEISNINFTPFISKYLEINRPLMTAAFAVAYKTPSIILNFLPRKQFLHTDELF